MPKHQGPLRWGIVGTSRICQDFVTALQNLPEHHEVTAVSAGDLSRAQQFAHKFRINKAFGKYQEILGCENVDIIYVGTVNSAHKHMVLAALNAGKHVLCEKPMGINYKEVKAMVDAARANKVFFMEAIWTRFFPAVKELVSRIKRGDIGDPKVVNATFSNANIHGKEDWRRDISKGGGFLLDMGIYLVQFASLIYGGEYPETIVANGMVTEDGADTTGSLFLKYKGGRSAHLLYSNDAPLANDGLVIGTKSSYRIPEFIWSPTKLENNKGEVENFEATPGGTYNFPNGGGLLYEAEYVRECLTHGLLEAPGMSLDESLTLSKIYDEIRKQLGVKYPQDD